MPRFTFGSATNVEGTTSTSGDNAIVAAPGAGKRIVLQHVFIQNASSTDTTYILKSGSTDLLTFNAPNQGDGIFATFAEEQYIYLGANAALNLNLSGANSTNYAFWYFVEELD